jgi:hypothetical protein
MKITTLAIRCQNGNAYPSRMEKDAPTELPPIYIRDRMQAAKPRVTAKVLAERMETSEAQISRLLGGQRKMTLEWMFAFSRALGVEIDALFRPPSDGDSAALGADTQLRSALLAFGVDRSQTDTAIRMIRSVFVEGDASPPQSQPHDQSEFANPRRAKVPSR